MDDLVSIITHKVTDFSDSRYQDLLLEACPSIRNRIEKYHFLKDRVLRIVGHQLLKYAINQTGASQELLGQIHFGAQGKPYIEGWNSYNLSYSCDRVVLAYGAVDGLGIDLERRKNIDIRAMRSICHPAEQRFMDSHASPIDAFYDIWVKKEAVLKSCGTGLTDTMGQIDCSGNQIFHLGHQWYFTPIRLPEDGYTCYLSASCDGLRFNMLDLGLDSIDL